MGTSTAFVILTLSTATDSSLELLLFIALTQASSLNFDACTAEGLWHVPKCVSSLQVEILDARKYILILRPYPGKIGSRVDTALPAGAACLLDGGKKGKSDLQAKPSPSNRSKFAHSHC
jgi:hypothetical protein